jgi:Carboxypeptidase regulatory-like domain
LEEKNMKIAEKMRNLSLFGLFFVLPALALAQTAGTGALTGNITDPAGAVVPDVQVKVTNQATGETRTVVSQSNGAYTVPLLPPGSYRLQFSKTGFKAAVKTELQVNVTETARLDVQLETGGVAEQVTITADAQLLQTESSALGRVTDRELVTNLPLVTRNYTQIVTLSPGIAAGVTRGDSPGQGDNQGDFIAHGGFARDNNFQMNGVQINDLQSSGVFSGGFAIPNPDTIQEFKVQTGLYDAAYGRNAGANVNVVTRGGGNKFHGTAFEFFRNNALNANEFFRNARGRNAAGDELAPRGVLKQNQFGGTFGGPIKKDKLLFFGSYQGMRQRNGLAGGGASSFFSPPLTNDRSRAALGKMFAGRTGAQGGVAVAADGSNISPQALAILNFKLPNGEFVIPSPQTIDASRPFDSQGFSTLSIPLKFNEDQFVANFDFLHTDKSKIEGRFFFSDNLLNQPLPGPNLGGPPAPGFPFVNDSQLRNFSATHNYTFSPNLFNQFGFGFHRTHVATIQEIAFKWSDVGVAAPSNADPFPQLAITGGPTLGGNGQGLNLGQNHFTFQDSLTWIRGRHTWRFGGGVTRSQLNVKDFHFIGGLNFLSWPDFLLGLPAGAGGNGSAFSNVFGSIDLAGLLDRNWRILDANAYAQDDIKLTPSFTINLGLRYERLGHLGDKLGRNSGFDISLANPNPGAGGALEGFVVSGNFEGTIPAGVTQVDNSFGIRGKGQNNFGPRLGFAWRLPGPAGLMKRMALRGGYGIYYTRATGQPFFQLLTSPPFSVVRQLTGLQNANASFARPFGPELTVPQFTPYSPATQRSLAIVDPNYRPPITQQYSLNLQTDLGRDMLLEVGYVGTKGTHQILAHSLNQARLASASSPIRGVTTNTRANISQRVPILGFTPPGIIDIDSAYSSRYDGLEVSLTKRLSKGLQFLTAYTFAHAYSDGATNVTAGGGSTAGNQDVSRANYGRPAFNREHRLVMSYVYQLPGVKRFPGFVNRALSGWSVAGVTTFQSGARLSFTGTNANNVFGITNDRAQLAAGCAHSDLTTSGSVHSRLANYFNRNCIARNAAGAAVWQVIGDDGIATDFGNSGVGIASGPDQRNFDLAVIKRTSLGRLGEGANIEFRAEFFNAFNTTQFANPGTNVSSANFGAVSATAVNPRIIQLALKLNF